MLLLSGCGKDPPGGIVQISIESQTFPGLQTLDMEVTSVEVVHQETLGDPETSISLTAEGSQTLRLVTSRGGYPRLVGQYELPAGFVSQFRFVLASSTMVRDGVESRVKLPSGPQTGLKLISTTGEPFVVEVGKTTRINMFFDSERQIIENSGTGTILKPVVRGEQLPPLDSTNRVIPNEVIVDFVDTLLPEDIDAINDELGVTILQEILPGNSFTLSLPDGVSFQDAIAFYSDRAEVEWVIPQYIFSFRATIPNDLSEAQWGLHNTGQTGGKEDADIDAPEAWDLTTGSTEVVFAIVDNGCDLTHPDLYLNIWINEGELPALFTDDVDLDGFKDADVDRDGIITFYDLNDPASEVIRMAAGLMDANSNGFIDGKDLLSTLSDEVNNDGNTCAGEPCIDDLVGWDFFNEDNDPTEEGLSHGTSVAGIIGATGDNGVVGQDEVAYSGVSWRMRIMCLKTGLDLGAGEIITLADIVLPSVAYSVAMGAHGVNISLGGELTSELLDLEQERDNFELAFDATGVGPEDANLLVVVAVAPGAKLDIDDPDFLDLPSEVRRDNIIVVTATNHDDEPASGVGFGKINVDLAAPGESVEVLSSGGGTAIVSGSSFAAPHVAGVAALIFARFPELRGNGDEVRTRIMDNVDTRDGAEDYVASGGRLNAFKALNAP